MNKLSPTEHDLVGKWMPMEGGVRADGTAERIVWLTKDVLEKVAGSQQWGAWETLFRDPVDGRLWERTYPNGEMHGGGPPRLTTIAVEQARAKYGLADL
jgi:Immunity protein 27